MLENSPSRNGWIIIAFSYGVFLFVLCFTLLVCSGSVRVYGLFTLERRKYDFCRNKCVYRTQYQNPPPRADRGVCNNRSFKPPQSAAIWGPPLESISIALRFHLNASIDGRAAVPGTGEKGVQMVNFCVVGGWGWLNTSIPLHTSLLFVVSVNQRLTKALFTGNISNTKPMPLGFFSHRFHNLHCLV